MGVVQFNYDLSGQLVSDASTKMPYSIIGLNVNPSCKLHLFPNAVTAFATHPRRGVGQIMCSSHLFLSGGDHSVLMEIISAAIIGQLLVWCFLLFPPPSLTLNHGEQTVPWKLRMALLLTRVPLLPSVHSLKLQLWVNLQCFKSWFKNTRYLGGHFRKSVKNSFIYQCQIRAIIHTNKKYRAKGRGQFIREKNGFHKTNGRVMDTLGKIQHRGVFLDMCQRSYLRLFLYILVSMTWTWISPSTAPYLFILYSSTCHGPDTSS